MQSTTRLELILSAAVPLGAWASVAPQVGGIGDYSSGLSAFLTGLTLVAAALTIGALALVIQSWRARVRPLYPGLVSALATLSIVFLSVAMGLGG